MRSFVAGQVMSFVRGWEESQPDLRDWCVSSGLTDFVVIDNLYLK